MTEIKDMSVEDFLEVALIRIATNAASVAAYGWDNEFSISQIKGAWNDNGSTPLDRKVTLAEIKTLSDAALCSLGFSRWDENLRLIPLWAFNFIADGEVLTAIDGEEKTKGVDEIDLDIRACCIAWGWKTAE